MIQYLIYMTADMVFMSEYTPKQKCAVLKFSSLVAPEVIIWATYFTARNDDISTSAHDGDTNTFPGWLQLTYISKDVLLLL